MPECCVSGLTKEVVIRQGLLGGLLLQPLQPLPHDIDRVLALLVDGLSLHATNQDRLSRHKRPAASATTYHVMVGRREDGVPLAARAPALDQEVLAPFLGT
jgi:hypothetical protein